MESWEAEARALIGREFAPVVACDPVNAAMVRHWCEAMGHPYEWDEALEAPATMLQCWLFPGPSRERPPGSATEDATTALKLLAQGGYEGVVTVSTELDFVRCLKPGDRLDYISPLESIGEEKTTALGLGRSASACRFGMPRHHRRHDPIHQSGLSAGIRSSSRARTLPLTAAWKPGRPSRGATIDPHGHRRNVTGNARLPPSPP